MCIRDPRHSTGAGLDSPAADSLVIAEPQGCHHDDDEKRTGNTRHLEWIKRVNILEQDYAVLGPDGLTTPLHCKIGARDNERSTEVSALPNLLEGSSIHAGADGGDLGIVLFHDLFIGKSTLPILS